MVARCLNSNWAVNFVGPDSVGPAVAFAPAIAANYAPAADTSFASVAIAADTSQSVLESYFACFAGSRLVVGRFELGGFAGFVVVGRLLGFRFGVVVAAAAAVVVVVNL